MRETVEYCRTRPHLLRRQGPTFLQLEVGDLWLNFWGDAHAAVPIKIASQSHTHDRGFSSTIVLGSITNTILQMVEAPRDSAPYEEYVLDGGDHTRSAACVPTGRGLSAMHASVTTYCAGEMYDMTPESWHRTLFTQPSITMLQLRGPKVPRYIAFPAGTPSASLTWVAADPVEAWNRIDGLMRLAGIS